jgi:tetratricopeptide (TPR) repeat protein
MLPKKLNAALVSSIFSCFALNAFSQTIDLNEVSLLIKDGKAKEALAILEPQELNHAGDADFDYLLGLASLDSGHSDKAMIIFDRIIVSNPKFVGARVEQGRAYFNLGIYDLAKQEFNLVIQENPPPSIMRLVRDYLDAIERIQKPKINNLTAYLELSTGHDSNVNASTSNQNIAIPALNNLLVTLDNASIKSPSNYVSTNFGVEFSHLIKPNTYIFGGVDLKKKNDFDSTPFNTADIGARFGLRGKDDDNNQYSFTVQKDRFYLGGRLIEII